MYRWVTSVPLSVTGTLEIVWTLKQTHWGLRSHFAGVDGAFSTTLSAPGRRVFVPLLSLALPAPACAGFQSHPLLPPKASSKCLSSRPARSPAPGQDGVLSAAAAPLVPPYSPHSRQQPFSCLPPADPTPAASLHPLTPTTVLPVFFPLASHSLQDMSHSLQWEIKVWIKICRIIPSLKAAFRLKSSKDKFPKERRIFRDRFLRSFSYNKMKLDASWDFFSAQEVVLKFAYGVCLHL